MRFKGRMELEHGLKPIDITPIINVIFLLLIFFMLLPSFITQPALRVNLPGAVTSQAVKYNDIEIIVAADNRLFLNNSAITLEELKKLLMQTATRKPAVLIKADRRANLAEVVAVFDLCRSIGVRQVNIATGQQ